MNEKEYGLPKELRQEILNAIEEEKNGHVRPWDEVKRELEQRISSNSR